MESPTKFDDSDMHLNQVMVIFKIWIIVGQMPWLYLINHWFSLISLIAFLASVCRLTDKAVDSRVWGLVTTHDHFYLLINVDITTLIVYNKGFCLREAFILNNKLIEPLEKLNILACSFYFMHGIENRCTSKEHLL